jgi:hypothetical protein
MYPRIKKKWNDFIGQNIITATNFLYKQVALLHRFNPKKIRNSHITEEINS